MFQLLRKDFLVLRRSPLLVTLLALYPALVAVLLGLAVGRPPAEPKIAIHNAVPAYDSDVLIGGREFDIRTFLRSIYAHVDEQIVDSKAEALAAVQSGDVVAAIVIPRAITDQLESNTGRAYVEGIFDASDPVKRSYVETTVKGLLVDTNRDLTGRFSKVALDYLDIVIEGGEISLGDRSARVLGLSRAQKTIPRLMPKLAPAEQIAMRDLLTSIKLAERGLDYADDLLARVGEPVRLTEKPINAGSSLSSFAVSVAVSVSAMFVALLIAAGMLAHEREDNVLARLIRGLVAVRTIVTEKAVLAALSAFFVGVVLLLTLGLFVDLRWSRAHLWLGALALGVAGFGAAGAAVGALARDVRAASLVSFMVGLPLAAAGLVPSGAVAPALYDLLQGLSALFPFKPALTGLQAALAPGRELATPLLHLTALVIGYIAIAWAGLARQREA